MQENDDFERANKRIHKVEDQWHYPIMTKYGFKPLKELAVGFVRQYKYSNGLDIITCNTGVNAEYWQAPQGFGYWADLEPHMKKHYNDQ